MLLIATLALGLVRAQADPGHCLRFTNLDGYVSVPHDVALNSYPLTVTAWLRTTNSAALLQGIVGKYPDGSGTGWQLLVQNGLLRGFYLRTLTSVAIDATSATSVADGMWHQAALTVDASGGKLYLDGALVGQSSWTGSAGAPVTSQPLEIGRYVSSAAPFVYPFVGDIDEVTVWNRSLDAREVNCLKHRHLNGNEDGLVALWHFDETSGPSASDATGHGHTGALQNSPARIASTAPLVFNAVAGTALSFDGGDDFVSVPHDAALDAFPLTVMAWVRTDRVSSPKDGIVSKYGESSGNGYSLFVAGGHLWAWYFHDGANYVYDGVNGVDGGFIADGFWHHIALVVDAAGGRFYVDGTPTGSRSWTGTPGAPNTTTNLQLGKYWLYNNSLRGALDEVSVWNAALTPAQISAYQHAPLTGAESGLVALWRLNDGSGLSANDLTGHGHLGALQNGVIWTGSTALLGDGTSATLVQTAPAHFTRAHAVQTAPGLTAFLAAAPFTALRLDDFGASAGNLDVTVTRQFTLTGSSSGAVPLADNQTNFNLALAPFNAAVPPAAPAGVVNQSVLTLQPIAQLDSVNSTYSLDVATTHSVGGGSPMTDEAQQVAGQRLLHFNGVIYFGPVATVFTNLSTSPSASSVSPPNFLSTTLKLPPGAAHVLDQPGVTFGDIFLFDFTGVNLGVDGTATNTSGVKILVTGPGGFEANGIRYSLSNATLSASGAIAQGVTVSLPAGFGVQHQPDVRVLDSTLTRVGALGLDGKLAPASNLVFTAASYGTNEFYFAEDTKPFFIVAPQLEWRIASGELYLAQADALQFVRQQADDDLAAQRGNLVEPLAADRISNDGYFRNVVATAGTPITVRADTNGVALLTLQATLQENEYRPHFPYLNRNVGGHLPVVGGALSISNGLVDPAASYLLLAGPAPVPYARDCQPGSCAAPATIGPQVLTFTAPPGHLGLGELGFTPEGGLLASGTVTPANLTWGFMGGTDFAQRTSDVAAGAYCVPGTFLPGTATAIADAQRPAVLLFSGWGDASNTNAPTYVERPGQSNYADGFANYAGLNFRAPAQGRSYLAGQDTGWYPLTARSKYYVRYGGVSGIHESASFAGNLTLYGYPFTFASYRLSFLDGDNWESRTDGQVALPYPSQFTVEFERMKFLCRGNLDSAELPATIAPKTMAYWNTVIQPLALDFKPSSDNPCSLSDRYLVLGVETKLPFIPNAFHARLGFKNDGNLATPATHIVEGIDSRFAVPANLQLQGPGGSYFPLTTAAEGYFNNYQSAPSFPGFFNLVGRLRVPFFRDVKVQLHVTPTGTSGDSADIALMGGWPAEEGLGTNRGWNLGTQNYFNTSKFDPNSDGWPAAVNLNLYRHSPDENYRPRAQRNWIEVAGFDYPLEWNSLTREFKGFKTSTVTLPVIDVGSDLKELSPGKVDFNFAEDLDLNLPHLKLLDLANQAINEVNAPLTTLSNALYGAVNTGGMTKGFNRLQTLLREDPDSFFRPVLETALTVPGSNVVDNLYTALASLAANKPALLANTLAIVGANSNGLPSAIQSLNGTTSDANKVAGQLAQTLADVDGTMQVFLDVLHKDPDGQRHSIRAIVQQLVHDQGIGAITGLADPVLDSALGELDPALTEIESKLTDLRARFQEVRSQIGPVPLTTDLYQSLQLASQDALALGTYQQQAGVAVSNLLNDALGSTGDFFTADPNRAKQEIRERLVLSFLGSPISGKYQKTFRQFFYDKNYLLDQIVSVLCDQINRAIRTGIEQQFGIVGAKDGVFNPMKGANLLSGSLASAKIRGAPTFQGDSLRAIHLDGQIQMRLPDEMDFGAFLDIRELDSASAPIACIPAGGSAAEVTLGANDIPLNWVGVPSSEPGKKLTLSLAAKWTLAAGAVKGIGGSLDINGKAGFKGCEMSEIKAALAIGEVENYFAAQAKATVIIIGIPVDFRAGMFAGHACSLDALKFIDPKVEEVVMQPGEFSGVYLEYGGGLSLSEILFGVSNDAIDVRAEVSSAFFYQDGPRFGRFGGRQHYDVDVKLLGVLEGSAGWTVFVVLDTANQLTIGGSAEVCGRLGVCPFCVKGCKDVTIKGVINDGGIDYFIDY